MFKHANEDCGSYVHVHEIEISSGCFQSASASYIILLFPFELPSLFYSLSKYIVLPVFLHNKTSVLSLFYYFFFLISHYFFNCTFKMPNGIGWNNKETWTTSSEFSKLLKILKDTIETKIYEF